MRTFMLFIAALSLPLISACQNPHAMPSGYTYHHEPYKAPPGESVRTYSHTDAASENDAEQDYQQ